MQSKEAFSAKLGHWTALYAAFLFLAGWSYLKSYFRVYGLDTGWLDLGFNDTVVHGFSVLFGSGAWLSIAYVSILVLTVFIEVFYSERTRIIDTILVICLVLLFPVAYWVAGRAGIAQANVDRGDKTQLPTITFIGGSCAYRGKLVYVKSELLYIYNLAYLGSSKGEAACSFDLGNSTSDVPQLWVARSGDIKDVRLIHYQKEATP